MQDHAQVIHIVCTFLTIEDLKGVMLCAGLSYIGVHWFWIGFQKMHFYLVILPHFHCFQMEEVALMQTIYAVYGQNIVSPTDV